MSKFSNHSERITSYLDGQMNPGEMAEFEKQLHTDPLLRSEFEFQQDIIHNIKDFRKTQLKTRLDQVPVGAGPGAMIGIKAAAALVISGIVGVGAYLYLNSTPDEIEAPAVSEVITVAPEESIVEQVTPAVEELTEEDAPDVSETIAATQEIEENTSPTDSKKTVPVSKKEKETLTIAPEETRVPEEESLTPAINSPRLATPNLEDAEISESIQVPNAGLTQDVLADNKVVAVETARKDENMFHYQYFNGKLYLYGDFRENPYEILELNSANGKRLFIFYNDNYYRILDDQQQITPLVQLTDQDIIKKLDIIQANK